MEENYSGCCKSLADYAEELTDEASEIPENLAFCIDYEAYGARLGAVRRYLHYRDRIPGSAYILGTLIPYFSSRS